MKITCTYIFTAFAQYFVEAPLAAITSPEMGSGWATPFNIHRVVPKPLLCYLSCVLGVVVLLEDESSLQSEVQSALEQILCVPAAQVVCPAEKSLRGLGADS